MSPQDGSTAPTPGARLPFRAVGLDDLRRLAASEPKGWLVDGLLPAAGVAMVIGAPFAGKSTLLAAISASVATCTRFAGRDTKRGPVVWVYQDRGSLSELSENLDSAVRGIGAKPGDASIMLITPPGWTLDDMAHVTWLRRYLDDVQASMVILDSLRRISSFDENRSQETTTVAATLRELTSANTRLVVPVHHCGKDGRIRGSSDLEAGCASVLRLDRSGDALRLTARHHGAAEHTVVVRAERSNGQLRFVASGGAAAASSSSGQRTAVQTAIAHTMKTSSRLSLTKLRHGVRAQGVQASNELLQEVLDELVGDGALEVETGGSGKAKLYGVSPA